MNLSKNIGCLRSIFAPTAVSIAELRHANYGGFLPVSERRVHGHRGRDRVSNMKRCESELV
jgi:hypothetical protein